jgi:hypothetical protein
LLNQNTYSLENSFNNQDEIHLAAFYDYADDKHVIASPGANIPDGTFTGPYQVSNWTTKNTTRFVKADIPVEAFNNCENDSLIYQNNLHL